MTINTEFTNWPLTGLDWDSAPYESCSPNLTALLKYAEARWPGFKSLGCHYDRPIRNGRTPSTHSFGAALDLGYDPALITRQVLTEEILPFLIANSKELGIQAIHDQGRIWRAYRWDDAGGGWKIYTTGYGNWIHVETSLSKFDDKTAIDTRLPKDPTAIVVEVPGPNTWLRFEPEEGEFGLWPIRTDLPTIKRVTGDVDKLHVDTCRFVQGVILHHAGGQIIVDGMFGRQTDARVQNVQEFFKLEVDGVVGPKTMGVIQYIAALNSSTHPESKAA